MNAEALRGFVDKLTTAPDSDRNLWGITPGNVLTTISPRCYPEEFNGLGDIVVYTDWGSPGSSVYEIPSQGLRAGHRRAVNNPYDHLLHGFVRFLKGDEVEVDTTRPLYLAKSSLYWERRWKDTGLVGSDYTWEIYPRVLRAMLDNLGTFDADTRDIHFVDLFGGDGEFVKGLQLKLSQQSRAVATFHIIDASSSSLDRARELFQNNEDVVIHPARYIQPDEPVFQGISAPPRIVTAIGGLCGSVISRQEALGITGQVYEKMAEGGLFVVTGRTGVLLNAEDFSRIGFKVRQMTVPENVVHLYPPYQLYILEK